MIKKIKSYISYYADPLCVIVEKVGQSPEFYLLTFLKEVASAENENLPNNWLVSVENFYASSPLNKADIEHLKAFGSNLGLTDIEHQERFCDEYATIFEERLKCAKNKRKEQTKLCKVCFVALGVFELIMLL